MFGYIQSKVSTLFMYVVKRSLCLASHYKRFSVSSHYDNWCLFNLLIVKFQFFIVLAYLCPTLYPGLVHFKIFQWDESSFIWRPLILRHFPMNSLVLYLCSSTYRHLLLINYTMYSNNSNVKILFLKSFSPAEQDEEHFHANMPQNRNPNTHTKQRECRFCKFTQ